ncbi:MAG: hypothetical protein Sapg2KO_20270 [Saprospiraceae bacterium]
MGLAPLHFGTELELLDKAIKSGNKVYVLKCNTGYASCYFNPCHNLIGCAICTARTDRFHDLLQIPKDQIFSIQHLLKEKQIQLPTFNHLNDLLDYEFEGINVGRGVASSVISLERDYAILDNERQQELINVQLEMAINALLNYRQIIEQVRPDEVYFFNGRFAEQFPMVEYCKNQNIPFFSHERGSSQQKYQVFDNALPHSIVSRQEIMAQLWQSSEKSIAETKAKKWFTDKRKGQALDDKSYLGLQKADQLPTSFDSKKHNIAIFNSSEDEMKAIGEWETPLYQHQNEVIQRLIEYFDKQDINVHFILRMHPNLGKVNNQQTKELYNLRSKNLTLIGPFEKVDSYALAEACDQILTFASTIGIEATFWNKPSILFGKAFYDNLDAVYTPKSFEALCKLIGTHDLVPKPKANTYQYGYFMANFGTSFKKFNYDGKFNSSFSKIKLDRITFKTLIHLIGSFTQFPIWWKLNKIIFNRRLNLKDLFRLKSHTHND